jgi:16S rRNA (guanine966-N2)-methyltransferase
VRIVAGELGGRQIIAPKTRGTRPVTDKVRAALFDILGPLTSLKVLDAYAGSGALGFEALSRGAQHVVGVEKGREAIQTITANIASLKLDWAYTLLPISVESWLARSPEQRFDLVLADPPHDALDSELLGRLGGVLAPGGTMVVEYPRRAVDHELEGLKLIDTRSYGDVVLAFYRSGA